MVYSDAFILYFFEVLVIRDLGEAVACRHTPKLVMVAKKLGVKQCLRE
jgi:hypothetical protein